VRVQLQQSAQGLQARAGRIDWIGRIGHGLDCPTTDHPNSKPDTP